MNLQSSQEQYLQPQQHQHQQHQHQQHQQHQPSMQLLLPMLSSHSSGHWLPSSPPQPHPPPPFTHQSEEFDVQGAGCARADAADAAAAAAPMARRQQREIFDLGVWAEEWRGLCAAFDVGGR
jgi:hypothetical protein